MALNPKDLEQIERIIYKNGDDICVANARAFERLEERIDAAESRIYSRMAELEDGIQRAREELMIEFADLTEFLEESQRAK
jgi:gas vesicle protein